MVYIRIYGGTDVGLTDYVGLWVLIPVEDDTKMTIIICRVLVIIICWTIYFLNIKITNHLII